MVVELHEQDFMTAEKLFTGNMFQLPALSVLDLQFPGRVFVDNGNNPEIALVWALSRWSYISCKDIQPKHERFIADAFNTFIRPVVNELGESCFEIYADNSAGWDILLQAAFNNCLIEKHYENTFTLNIEKFNELNMDPGLPGDIKIIEHMYPIAPEPYFKFLSGSMKNKQVLGMSLNKNGKVISQCINNGFIHDNKYFIDLDTFSGCERNKGYGTFIAYSLISKQLANGFLPLWETTVKNLPSQKVAYKLGFERLEEYPVYTITKL
ncbi:MAG: acetyltransferase [Eubacterium sp.]|nr:acetyltransferase [Eubacterium sp.]